MEKYWLQKTRNPTRTRHVKPEPDPNPKKYFKTRPEPEKNFITRTRPEPDIWQPDPSLHRRKIIISTFLKCFTLHWLEYLVHFFTLSTNDDIKTPIFIARIYCIGSFFKPKKILFYIPWSFPKWTLFTMQRQRFQKWFAE